MTAPSSTTTTPSAIVNSTIAAPPVAGSPVIHSSVAKASRLCDAAPRVGSTRVPRWLLAACGVAIIISLSFAIAPLDRPHIETPALETPAPAEATPQLAALDLDAFRAPIWVADPPPPAPPPTLPPPPPLRLQLLAIIREPDSDMSTSGTNVRVSSSYRATLYDPDTDRLYVVTAGDIVGTRTVEHVDAGNVRLSDAAGPRTLSLRDPPQGGNR